MTKLALSGYGKVGTHVLDAGVNDSSVDVSPRLP